MAPTPPATGPPSPVASLAYLHKDAGPPEERGCFVVGPPDHALLGGFANVSVAPAGAAALHIPLYYLEAALLSVVSGTILASVPPWEVAPTGRSWDPAEVE